MQKQLQPIRARLLTKRERETKRKRKCETIKIHELKQRKKEVSEGRVASDNN
jgi:hypothetical protein